MPVRSKIFIIAKSRFFNNSPMTRRTRGRGGNWRSTVRGENLQFCFREEHHGPPFHVQRGIFSRRGIVRTPFDAHSYVNLSGAPTNTRHNGTRIYWPQFITMKREKLAEGLRGLALRKNWEFE